MVETTKVYPLSSGVRKAILAEVGQHTWQVKLKEDSLPRGRALWPLYDASSSSFGSTFAPFLPSGKMSLVEYIQEVLVRKKGSAVGIEFGGPGSRLFHDFSEGFFCQTAGVTLADRRIGFLRERDNGQSHSVIVGDIFAEETQNKVAQWLAGRKVDVIFERMAGGLDLVPQEPRFLSEIASWWYRILAEGGIMFLEIPDILRPVMEEWKDYVEQNYRGQIQLKQRLHLVNPVLMLQKQVRAPSNLPLLPPRTVRDLYKRCFFPSPAERAQRLLVDLAVSNPPVDIRGNALTRFGLSS